MTFKTRPKGVFSGNDDGPVYHRHSQDLSGCGNGAATVRQRCGSGCGNYANFAIYFIAEKSLF
jgi:hypothetical protein